MSEATPLSAWRPATLSGFGRTARVAATTVKPASEDEVLDFLRQARGPVLARGAGLSYGDAALQTGGNVLDVSRLDSIHRFDSVTGCLEAGAGVTFGAVLRTFAPLGWMPPTTPGTEFVTLGGALANDVHGKNHDADGSFGDHVVWFDLVLPDGSCRRVDADSDPALFAATIAGIGLTGIVTRLAVQLARAPSSTVLLRERRIGCLAEYLDALAEVRSRHRFTVGWIDGIARGQSMGRGILEAADFIEDPRPLPRRRRITVPVEAPIGLINRHSVRAFNGLYFRRIPRVGRERRVDLARFFYPLDSLIDWNLLYGPRGFHQFQCVIPDGEAGRALPVLLERIAGSGYASFLAVIKTLGGAGRGYLSFAMRGITLALDMPNGPGVVELIRSLHELTAEHGGRIYLAKDSCMTPALFARTYPHRDEYQAVRRRVDPGGRMWSDMSCRLQL